MNEQTRKGRLLDLSYLIAYFFKATGQNQIQFSNAEEKLNSILRFIQHNYLINNSSPENKKVVTAAQRCFIESQKGATAVDFEQR